MTMNMDQEFFDEVLRHLDIIYEVDDDTKLKIQDLINDGKAVLEFKAQNNDIDWEDSFNKRILKEYVRFSYNGLTDFFDDNFITAITEFCIKNEVYENGKV